MNKSFCKDNMKDNNIIKCISIKDKNIFVFMPLYYLEDDFKKGNKITWHSNRKKGYGIVIKQAQDIIEIQNEEDGLTMNIPITQINHLHPIDSALKQSKKIYKKKKKIFSKMFNQKKYLFLKNY